MRNIRLIIEYDGSRYQGWQRLGGDKNQNTIQAKLETVLTKMMKEDIKITGSGRTDAGVHAYGQTANFHTNASFSCQEIREYLMTYLPTDIGILKVEEAGDRFHSRLNAKSKTYLYRIGIPGMSHVFDRKYLWQFPEVLDLNRMKEAANYYIGSHDFKGFSSIKKTKKSTVREIYNVSVKQLDREIQISYTGNGFLHNMVRILTGTLVEIGRGTMEPEDILTVYQTKDRKEAGMTAPPQGLFLVNVEY